MFLVHTTPCDFTETLESRAAADAPSPIRFADWQNVWERCTQLEKGFWDMAMNLER